MHVVETVRVGSQGPRGEDLCRSVLGIQRGATNSPSFHLATCASILPQDRLLLSAIVCLLDNHFPALLGDFQLLFFSPFVFSEPRLS